MASTHKWDMAVQCGEYVGADGVVKKRNKTIGKIMVSDNGREYAMLDPFVNLAAFPRQGDMLMVSLFAPREQAPRQGGAPRNSAPPPADDSDIPF